MTRCRIAMLICLASIASTIGLTAQAWASGDGVSPDAGIPPADANGGLSPSGDNGSPSPSSVVADAATSPSNPAANVGSGGRDPGTIDFTLSAGSQTSVAGDSGSHGGLGVGAAAQQSNPYQLQLHWGENLTPENSQSRLRLSLPLSPYNFGSLSNLDPTIQLLDMSHSHFLDRMISALNYFMDSHGPTSAGIPGLAAPANGFVGGHQLYPQSVLLNAFFLSPKMPQR